MTENNPYEPPRAEATLGNNPSGSPCGRPREYGLAFVVAALIGGAGFVELCIGFPGRIAEARSVATATDATASPIAEGLYAALMLAADVGTIFLCGCVVLLSSAGLRTPWRDRIWSVLVILTTLSVACMTAASYVLFDQNRLLWLVLSSFVTIWTWPALIGCAHRLLKATLDVARQFYLGNPRQVRSRAKDMRTPENIGEGAEMFATFWSLVIGADVAIEFYTGDVVDSWHWTSRVLIAWILAGFTQRLSQAILNLPLKWLAVNLWKLFGETSAHRDAKSHSFHAESNEVRDVLAELEDIEAELGSGGLGLPPSLMAEVRSTAQEPQRIAQALVVEGLAPRDVAWLVVLNVAAEHLASGDLHVYRGVLSIPGKATLRLYNLALERLEASGYQDATETQKDREWIHERIRSAG